MAEIVIKGVAKSFGSFQALHSIDLTIADQEFMVLLGASGCGKTTLLRIIAGLETPTQGEVWIGGRRVDQLPPRERGIAMVFQNYAVFPHLTVFENIAFGLRMKKLPQADVERRVTRTAELMHIEQLLKRYSGQLSGGQRQRVAVARALAMEPDVILMDEPLSNLDALLRLEMRAELKGVLANSKTTTIYVTHDQVEAMSLADRISVMNGGKIVQAASPVEVYRNPAARFVGSFIGNPPMNFIPAVKNGDGRYHVAGLSLDGPSAGGARLEFAIRPEDVTIAPGGLKATARVIEPLGAHTLVTSEVEGALFRAVLDSDLKVAPGDELSLVPKPNRIRWFDPRDQPGGDLMLASRSPLADMAIEELRENDRGSYTVPTKDATLTDRTRTMTPDTTRIYDHALEVLKENDQGTYTVPTKGLYPFQWNWDSCLTALGQFHYDEARAWTEIETLFAHQWPDGMVPHIVFHVYSDGYFPGPNVWNTGRPTATSGITQPPVAGFAIRRLYERAIDKAEATRCARALLAKVDAWHRWFYEMRDPHGEGLVAILHPWESGRDNSIDWDEAFERVPTEGVDTYVRRDTQHADPAHRPTKAQYDRYLWLVQHFRELNWDNSKLHDASPFQVVDPGFNAILIRSSTDLAALAEILGEHEIAEANRQRAAIGLKAMETLWSEAHGQYLCKDRTTGQLIDSASIGGILPVFAAVPRERAQEVARTIEKWAKKVKFIVPSHDPDDPRFEAKRYWRAPVWLVMNYMIADGLRSIGEIAVADHIVRSSLELITQSGFAEYYDPTTGEPCGGGRFTWTAAMVIEFLEAA